MTPELDSAAHAELKGIVQKMLRNGESEANIGVVIEEFAKRKRSQPKAEIGTVDEHGDLPAEYQWSAAPQPKTQLADGLQASKMAEQSPEEQALLKQQEAERNKEQLSVADAFAKNKTITSMTDDQIGSLRKLIVSRGVDEGIANQAIESKRHKERQEHSNFVYKTELEKFANEQTQKEATVTVGGEEAQRPDYVPKTPQQRESEFRGRVMTGIIGELDELQKQTYLKNQRIESLFKRPKSPERDKEIFRLQTEVDNINNAPPLYSYVTGELTGQKQPTAEEVKAQENAVAKAPEYAKTYKNSLGDMLIKTKLKLDQQKRYLSATDSDERGVSNFVKGTISTWPFDPTPEQKAMQVQVKEFYDTLEEYHTLKRAYLLNKNPAYREKGFWSSFKEAFQANETIAKNSEKVMAEKLKSISEQTGLPVSKELEEAVKPSIKEMAGEGTAEALKILPGLIASGATIEFGGAMLGITAQLDKLRKSATLADRLVYGVMKSMEEGAKFKMAGESFASGAGFGAAGQIVPDITFKSSNPVLNAVMPLANWIYKAGIGGTAGMETAKLAEAATQSLAQNEDFKKVMKEHFGENIGDVERGIFADAVISMALGMGGLKIPELKSKSQKWNKLAENLQDRGFTVDAAQIRDKVAQAEELIAKKEEQVTRKEEKKAAKLEEEEKGKAIQLPKEYDLMDEATYKNLKDGQLYQMPSETGKEIVVKRWNEAEQKFEAYEIPSEKVGDQTVEQSGEIVPEAGAEGKLGVKQEGGTGGDISKPKTESDEKAEAKTEEAEVLTAKPEAETEGVTKTEADAETIRSTEKEVPQTGDEPQVSEETRGEDLQREASGETGDQKLRQEEVKEPPVVKREDTPAIVRQKAVNNLLQKIDSYNALSKGSRGKGSSEGAKTRNEIMLTAQEMGIEIKNNGGILTAVGGKGKKIKKNFSYEGNKAPAESHTPLTKRSKESQDLFNRLNELGASSMPEVIGADGKRMSAKQIKAAIKDVQEGNPTNGAEALLNKMDETLRDGYIEITHPDTRETVRKSLDEYFEAERQVEEEYQSWTPEDIEREAAEYKEWLDGLSKEEQTKIEEQNAKDEQRMDGETEPSEEGLSEAGPRSREEVGRQLEAKQGEYETAQAEYEKTKKALEEDLAAKQTGLFEGNEQKTGKEYIDDGWNDIKEALSNPTGVLMINPRLVQGLAKVGYGLILEGKATIKNVIEELKKYVKSKSATITDAEVDAAAKDIIDEINNRIANKPIDFKAVKAEAKKLKQAIVKEARGFIQQRRANIDIANYETTRFVDAINQRTTKAEREVLPFIIEGTGIPENLNRPDLVKVLEESKDKLEPIAKEIKEHFDEMWQKIAANTDNLSNQQIDNYITHIWDIPKNKLPEVRSWFQTHNRFLNKRYISTLEEGVDLYGLQPKYLDVGDIIKVHDATTNIVIENNKLLDNLKKMEAEGMPLILRMDKAPEDWITTDHPALKANMYIPSDKPDAPATLIKMPYKIHPDLKEPVEAIFGSRFDHPAIRVYERLNNSLKKIALSVSLFHHAALTETALPAIGVGKTAKAWAKEAALKAIRDRAERSPLLDYPEETKESIQYGWKYGYTSDIAVEQIQGNLEKLAKKTEKIPGVSTITKALAKGNKVWDAVLWDYIHDPLKLYAFMDAKETALKKGLTGEKYDVFMREMGQLANDRFGGQNWDNMLVSPKTQQMMGWLLLSPDWTVSKLRLALGVTGVGAIEKDGRAVRAKADAAFWVKAAIIYGLGVNALNAFYREKDKKENPEYYPDGIKPIDYTMWGNTIGHKTHLFTGRYKDGSEKYLRWGKEFRELPELIMDDEGISFPGPLVHKMGAKMAPGIQYTAQVFTGKTMSGYENWDTKDKKGWEWTAGIMKTFAKGLAPFSSQNLFRDDKEWSPADLAFPSSKGMTRSKAIELFKKGIGQADEAYVREIYANAIRNNLDAFGLFKTSMQIMKSERTKELKKEVKSVEDIKKKLTEDITEQERKSLQGMLKQKEKEVENKQAAAENLDTAIEEMGRFERGETKPENPLTEIGRGIKEKKEQIKTADNDFLKDQYQQELELLEANKEAEILRQAQPYIDAYSSMDIEVVEKALAKEVKEKKLRDAVRNKILKQLKENSLD